MPLKTVRLKTGTDADIHRKDALEMTNEPKKIIKNLDLTCFEHNFSAKRDDEQIRFFIMGTSQAFAQLLPLFENQLSMASQHTKATKTLILRKPWEFKDPFQKSAFDQMDFNNRTVRLEFFDNIKIKLDTTRENCEIKASGLTLEVTCTKFNMEEIIGSCQARKINQSHGMGFVHGKPGEPEILCPPLGDWLGIE